MVARCGLEPRHDRRSVEVPQWMFDTAVCCQMRMAQEPVTSIDALRELKALRATRSPAIPDHMLQAQHDSLLLEGGCAPQKLDLCWPDRITRVLLCCGIMRL
jgi:hypothetical protein